MVLVFIFRIKRYKKLRGVTDPALEGSTVFRNVGIFFTSRHGMTTLMTGIFLVYRISALVKKRVPCRIFVEFLSAVDLLCQMTVYLRRA